MTSIPDLKQWLATLNPENSVGVDEGGLTLCEIDKDGETTGAQFEIGGFDTE